MSNGHLDKRVRRVVAGLDAAGRSTIVEDSEVETRLALPAFTVNDIWRLDGLPTRMDALDTLTGEVELDPPPEGIVVLHATFPPDSELDRVTVGSSIDSLVGTDGNANDERVMGMHFTDTVDVLCVVEGEIHLVTETGEVLLKVGDCAVNRGNKHAWSNRSDKPATLMAVMVPAER